MLAVQSEQKLACSKNKYTKVTLWLTIIPSALEHKWEVCTQNCHEAEAIKMGIDGKSLRGCSPKIGWHPRLWASLVAQSV